MKALKEILIWLGKVIKPPKNENWKVVMLCFLAATTFWFFNALNKNYTTRISHPIDFDFEREGVIIVEDLPSKVSLNVSGGGWNLLRKSLSFNTRPLTVRLDNPTEIEFLTSSRLYQQISEQINEVRLNFVMDDTLFINIEKRLIKKLPLAVDSTKINLDPNYKIISEVKVNPDSIIFEGPESIIETLPEWIIISIPQSGIKENYSEDVKINLEESKIVKYYPERVRVSFAVAQFISKTKNVPVELLNFPEDSSIYLQNPTVELSFFVEEKFKEEQDESQFKVIANLKRLNSADSTVKPILLEHPEFAQDISLNPSAIKVIYDRRKK